jgi:uncharacterized membrane protein YfcA
LDPVHLSILCITALLTSILSAIVGMAGGITLLAVMLLFLEPLTAIPLHGAVQLVSNASRTWIQRSHVRWGILTRFGALLIPAGVVGLAVANSLPAELARALIGLFVLLATWAPASLLIGTRPEASDPNRRFLLLGGVAGVLNMTVGATGPLIAPFFLGLGLSRQTLVGTKAACQTLGHLVKLGVFGVAGFVFAPWLAPLALLAAMVVAGTWIGSRLLERVSERWFVRAYKTVLTLIALRLVLGEAAAWIGLH